jgi:hypothetical protein
MSARSDRTTESQLTMRHTNPLLHTQMQRLLMSRPIILMLERIATKCTLEDAICAILRLCLALSRRARLSPLPLPSLRLRRLIRFDRVDRRVADAAVETGRRRRSAMTSVRGEVWRVTTAERRALLHGIIDSRKRCRLLFGRRVLPSLNSDRLKGRRRVWNGDGTRVAT